MPEPCDMVWSSDRTTPAQVEAALRAMLIERHGVYAGCVPARTLNLVCVVDAPVARGATRAAREPRPRHTRRARSSARSSPGERTIGAIARIGTDMHPRPGEFAALRETVVLDVGERHLPHLESIVDPLVVSDVPTVVWSPSRSRRGGPRAAPRSRRSCCWTPPRSRLAERGDAPHARLARGTPASSTWRGCARRRGVSGSRRASIPPPLRADLERIRAVTVRHHAGSAVAALLLVGWLAAQLEWRLQPTAAPADAAWRASRRAPRRGAHRARAVGAASRCRASPG